MPKSKFAKEINTLRGLNTLSFTRKTESFMLTMLAYNIIPMMVPLDKVRYVLILAMITVQLVDWSPSGCFHAKTC